ncbi:efflux RND transporter periplasmic adaptor subunit [Desulfonauticus submarinus]
MSKNNKKLKLATIAFLSLGLLYFIYWYIFLYGTEYTDDAYVEADIARVSSRIPGNIQKIYIDNDDYVQKGDPLIELDPKDILAQKKVLLCIKKRILAQIEGEKIRLQTTDSKTLAAVEAAEANLKAAKLLRSQTENQIAGLKNQRQEIIIALSQARKDLQRFIKLWEKRLIAKQTLEQNQNLVKTLEEKLKAVENQIKAAQKISGQARAKIKAALAVLKKNQALRKELALVKANLQALKASLEEIKAKISQIDLNLSYTKIKAPISGYIAQKKIQIGDRVMPGEPLLAIVPLDKIYVEANFKETQLTHMYIGQKAIIKPDIYPNLKLEGKVIGIRAGTGTVFSPLPPENAVGNWIKVVQRVPVKIIFTSPIPKKYPLRVGLSLEVTVDTSKKTGPRLRQALKN